MKNNSFFHFASYYNKVVATEGTSVNDYDGDRKQINNLKAALLGERHSTNVATGSDRSTSVNGALAFMLRGLEKYQGNRNGFNNDKGGENFLTLSRSSMGMGSGRSFAYVHKEKELDNLKTQIQEIDPSKITDNEKLPWTEFDSTKADAVTVTNEQDGGAIDTKTPAWNDLGPLQVLGMLIEGHAILLKAQDDGMGENEFRASNLTSLISGLRDKKTIHKNGELNDVLDMYIDKYIEILRDVYYPSILTLKTSVKAAKRKVSESNTGTVRQYKNARYKIQVVQAHLLLALYYFSRLYYPADAKLVDECNPANIKNLFDSYGVNGEKLKKNGNYLIDAGEIVNEDLDFTETFELQKELLEAIDNVYDDSFKDYAKKFEEVNKKLKESSSEAEVLKSMGYDKILKKSDGDIQAQDEYLTNIINGESSVQSGGGKFNVKNFGISKIAASGNFKENLEAHKLLLKKNIKEDLTTVDLKDRPIISKPPTLPKEYAKPMSASSHEEMQQEFYKNQYKNGINKLIGELGEFFQVGGLSRPPNLFVFQEFIIIVHDKLNKLAKENNYFEFITSWMRVIGKLDAKIRGNDLIIFS